MANQTRTQIDNGVIEEFWDDLLAFIEDGRVIPVVGAELYNIVIEGREVPLYRALAERLLAKHGLQAVEPGAIALGSDLEVVLHPHVELNDAVSALVHGGRRLADLYRPINDSLRELIGPQLVIPAALRELAAISDFHLFVTTTFDDLLARTLNEVRYAGAPLTEQIVYAPNLPGKQARDISELKPSNYCALFYLFGRASPSPFYAIDDEDILEFIYNLQAEHGVRPERMLAELRQCHLLIIGCNFADWLGRFFIRLANQMRLSSDRPKKEFLVGDETTHDRGLTLFLEHFSQNTRIYPGEAHAFVTELLRRWKERHPIPQEIEPGTGTASPVLGTGEIFISYSRTDLAAAKALCSGLESLGAGVIWLDKGVLRPGDEWERQITAGLMRCDLFLPLVSTTTEARTDGYFRKEWFKAADRSKMIEGRSFIVPVVVDSEFDGNANRYKLMPDRFRDFQFGHAPGGRISEELRKTIIEAVRDLRRRRST